MVKLLSFVSVALGATLVPLAAQVHLGSVSLNGQPIGALAVDPIARRAYVGGGYAQMAMTVVDASSAAHPVLLRTLPYAGAAVQPARNRLYASTGYAGGLIVLDATTYAPVTTVGVGYCGGALDADPNTGLVYLMSQCGGGNDPIHVLDSASNTIVAGPLGSGGVANLVRVNPATGRAYAARGGGTRVFDAAPGFAVLTNLAGTVVATSGAQNRVFLNTGGAIEVRDGASHVLLGSIPGAFGGSGVVDDARHRLYVNDPAAKAVRVFDSVSLAGAGSIALPSGQTPWQLALDPRQGVLFVVTDQGGATTLHTYSLRDDVTALPADPLLPQPGAIAADDADLFVANQNPLRLTRRPPSGGAAAALYSLPAPHCCVAGLAVAGASMFWIDPNSGPVTDTQIFRAPKSGAGPVQAIYTGSSVGQPIVDGSDLATDGAWLYSADYYHGRVHRVSLDGATVVQLGPERYGGGFATEQHVAIAVDAGVVYVCDVGRAGTITPGVRTIAASGGGAFTTLWAGAPFVQPIDLVVANGTVFVADPGAGNTIWTLPVTGGTPRALVAGAPFVGLRALVLRDDALYATDGDAAGGSIWKVTFGITGYGAGCLGSGGHVPVLDFHGGPPFVGNSAFGLQVERGLGGAPTALFLGLGQSVAGLPIGADCRLFLDPLQPILNVPPAIALGGAGAGGGRGVFGLPLPANPSLVGGALWFQTLSLDAGGGTASFTLTGGVGIRFLPQ